jgi:uncharacterized protein YjbJ (UPF0337 family)
MPDYTVRATPSWLFEGVPVQPTLFFQLGYGLEPVGVSLRVSLNLKVRDRQCLFDFPRHVLWRQREDEGHGITLPCAISKVAQPIKLSVGADKFKLRLGLNIINHDTPLHKGKIKEKWGKLTDDDLTKINGQREQLEGIIQQRYGLARDMVRKDIDAWLNSQP